MANALDTGAAGDDAPSGAPLAGLRVLDFSRILAGPFLGQCLASLGADVVKVEPPDGDPTRRQGSPQFRGVSYYFHGTNSGKRSIALDLTTEAGRAVAWRLAMAADVLLENFRPGVMERFGLASSRVRAANPRLVYASLTAFGLDAPESERRRPAFDLTIQARSGAMSLQGRPGEPPSRSAIPTGDLAAAVFGAMAVLSSLLRRQATGVGATLDVSLLDAQLFLLGNWVAQASLANAPPAPAGAAHASAMPYDVYRAADGWLAVAVFTDRFWVPFSTAIERLDLSTDTRFATGPDRVARRAELDAVLRPLLAARRRAEWLERFRRHGVPAEAVADVRQALDDPLFAERGTLRFEEDAGARLVRLAFPAKFDGAAPFAGPAPSVLGGDRDAVLRAWLGVNPSELEAWTRGGAFGPPPAG
jgi:crotonobetainyl-CoA:carnitine CoA-transferase CaiB-like acyl-CoA transferase